MLSIAINHSESNNDIVRVLLDYGANIHNTTSVSVIIIYIYAIDIPVDGYCTTISVCM